MIGQIIAGTYPPLASGQAVPLQMEVVLNGSKRTIKGTLSANGNGQHNPLLSITFEGLESTEAAEVYVQLRAALAHQLVEAKFPKSIDQILPSNSAADFTRFRGSALPGDDIGYAIFYTQPGNKLVLALPGVSAFLPRASSFASSILKALKALGTSVESSTPEKGQPSSSQVRPTNPPQAPATPVKKVYDISSLQSIHREIEEGKLTLEDLTWLASSDLRTLYRDQARLFRLVQTRSLQSAGRLGTPWMDEKNVTAYQEGARQYLAWRASPESALPPVGSSLKPSQIADPATRKEIAEQIWGIAIGRASYSYAGQTLGYASLSAVTAEGGQSWRSRIQADKPLILVLKDQQGKEHQIGQITPGDKSADELFAEMKQRIDEFHAERPPVATPQEPLSPARPEPVATQPDQPEVVEKPSAERASEPSPAGVSTPPPKKPTGSPNRENMALYIAYLRNFYEGTLRSQAPEIRKDYERILGPLPEILNIMENYHQTGTMSAEQRAHLSELVDSLKSHVDKSYIGMLSGSEVLREFILFLSGKFPIGEKDGGALQGFLDFASAVQKNTPVGSGFAIIEGLWRTLFGPKNNTGTEGKPLYVTPVSNADPRYVSGSCIINHV